MESSDRWARRCAAPARGWLVATIVSSVVAGCATPTVIERAPPPPQLLEAGPLELPAGCEATRGMVYRTNFVVAPDGQVSEARSETGDGCVEAALRRWVSSFRYQSVAERTPVAFDWMLVTASRGG